MPRPSPRATSGSAPGGWFSRSSASLHSWAFWPAACGREHNAFPYALTVLFFLAAFATLGVMMWPYMIPYALTVADAAAPDASLRFFFYGGIVVLPVIAAYTVAVYLALSRKG